MRRFIAIFIGFGLVGCVAETDPSAVDDVSDAVEVGGTESSFFVMANRKSGAVLGIDFSRVADGKQALAAEDVYRPPPTPLREVQASPPWPAEKP